MSFLLHLIGLSCLALGGSFALGGVVEAWHALRLWRAVRMKASELVGAAASLVDVRGAVRIANPITAPLTGRSCAQYTCVVSRAVDKTKPQPKTRDDTGPEVVVLTDAAPFAVDDGSGRILIDLKKRSVPVTGHEMMRQKLERLTRPLDVLMTARLGRPAGLWCAGREVQATEVALVEGIEVSVVAKRTADGYEPIHVTPGRPRVVAMQSWMRAAMSAGIGAAMIFMWYWLRS